VGAVDDRLSEIATESQAFERIVAGLMKGKTGVPLLASSSDKPVVPHIRPLDVLFTTGGNQTTVRFCQGVARVFLGGEDSRVRSMSSAVRDCSSAKENSGSVRLEAYCERSYVRSFCVSHDGRWIACGTGAGSLQLFHLSAASSVSVLRSPFEVPSSVYEQCRYEKVVRLDVSAGAIVSLEWTSFMEQNVVVHLVLAVCVSGQCMVFRLCAETMSVEKVGELDHSGAAVSCLQVAQYAVATGGSDGVVRFFDLRRMECLRKVETSLLNGARGPVAAITSLGFDEQTFRYIATADATGELRVIDLLGDRIVLSLSAGQLHHIIMMGTKILYCSGQDVHVVEIGPPEDRTQVGSVAEQLSFEESMISHKSTASTGASMTVKQRHVLGGTGSRVNCIAVDREHLRVYGACSDGSLRVWSFP
jgi:WD40 repeat protein